MQLVPESRGVAWASSSEEQWLCGTCLPPPDTPAGSGQCLEGAENRVGVSLVVLAGETLSLRLCFSIQELHFQGLMGFCPGGFGHCSFLLLGFVCQLGLATALGLP
jgi:hypothetical protein